MPTGIILKSASHEISDEVREKNLAAVVESAGYEVQEKAEDVLSEPQRNGFKTEEEFEAAHVAWQDKEDDKEEKAAEAAAPKPTVEPKKLSRRERAVERATAELKKQNEDLQKRLEALEGKKPADKTEPETQVRPKRADFDSDETYEDALLAWGVQKTLSDKALKDVEKASQSRFNETIQNYAA